MKTKNVLFFAVLATVNMNVVAGEQQLSAAEDIKQFGKVLQDFGKEWVATPFSENIYKPAQKRFNDALQNIKTRMEQNDELSSDTVDTVVQNVDNTEQATTVTTVKSKVVDSWNGLSNTQKYAFGATALAVVAAGIAYQLGYFSKSQDITFTEQDVQAIVEAALADVAQTEENKLNHIVQVLLNNGLGNVVVYSDNMFEVEDTFKVEFNENNVCVTRK